MKKQTMIFCFAGLILIMGQGSVGKTETSTAITQIKQESHTRTIPSSLTGKKNNDQRILTLNCLRDSALSLQQIKQQAINIYLEATRTDVQPQDPSVFPYPKSISTNELTKGTCYLPPRIEWLYFYVGTMEPIIRLFTDDISDSKTGMTKIFVPAAAKEDVSPLWAEWSAGIKRMNDHLSDIYSLANEDEPDNIAIAKNAVAIYKIGGKLEKAREKATDIIRKVQLKGKESTPIRIE